MRLFIGCALLAALAGSGCTELPEAPDVGPVVARFATPTGSIKALAPDALGALLKSEKNTTAPLQTPSESAADAVDDSTAQLTLPVDGYVRITRQCDGVVAGDEHGFLRATLRVEHEQPFGSFHVEAANCRGDFAGNRQLNGSFAISIASKPWLVAAFEGETTPITAAGVLDTDKTTSIATALRVCIGANSTACQLHDAELSVDVAAQQNVVFILSASRALAGIRDRDGLWSCAVDTVDATASTCSLAANTVTIPGANQ